jgi:hypothetical protein
MYLVRGIAALGVSAIIATATLVTVNHSSNEANQTAKDITRQSLQYQRDSQKAVQDATKAATDASKSGDVDTAKLEADTDKIVDNANDAAKQAIENVEDNTAIPADAQKAIDAAKAQIDAAK